MSNYYVCDFCGQQIEEGEGRATWSVQFDAAALDVAGNRSGLVAHYHASGGCNRSVLGLVRGFYESLPLEKIPTATPQKIGALRRRHTRGDAGDDA